MGFGEEGRGAGDWRNPNPAWISLTKPPEERNGVKPLPDNARKRKRTTPIASRNWTFGSTGTNDDRPMASAATLLCLTSRNGSRIRSGRGHQSPQSGTLHLQNIPVRDMHTTSNLMFRPRCSHMNCHRSGSCGAPRCKKTGVVDLESARAAWFSIAHQLSQKIPQYAQFQIFFF